MMDCVRMVPAVINAFAAMGIFVAIFSVAAFDLFSDRDPDNFGSFFRALFSMFQVCAARCIAHGMNPLQQIYRIKCFLFFAIRLLCVLTVLELVEKPENECG
jgi:peptidoglycan/LPS O-acetylase OafA/YrhL